jgi:hypothetical protein
MATDARGPRVERIAFSIMRNGLRTVFFEDTYTFEEDVCREFDLISHEDRIEELFEETSSGFEC